jgi:hypothetical protein
MEDGALSEGESPMPIYISRGRFTTDAVKGMLAKPENREEAVTNLFKSCGGKLIGWYLTFGHHDCPGDPNPRLQAKDKVDEVALCDDIDRALTPSTTSRSTSYGCQSTANVS